IIEAHAAYQCAARLRAGGRHDLALDRRYRRDDTWELFDLRGEIVVTGQRTLRRIDIDMPVEAEDAAQKLGAEAIHHRHSDDESRDTQRDTGQREDRDDRDKAFLAPRAQITEGDQP